jgi:hypothetical protein
MPPLACFSLKLGEKPPDPEEVCNFSKKLFSDHSILVMILSCYEFG